MLTRSVQDADANFSELLADVKRGETVVLTESDRPVAEVRPVAKEEAAERDEASDPVWLARRAELIAMLTARPRTGFRLGRITEEDKRGRGSTRW